MARPSPPRYGPAMSSETAGGHQIGQTVLAAEVATAEPLVKRWRAQLGDSATEAARMPAHVTVLGPFLPMDQCTAPVIEALGAVIGAHGSFTVRFEHCGRFPGVLYLVPEPDQPFRDLTAAIAARWPEAPPYGGQFTEVTPHLTVVHGHEPETLDRFETTTLTSQLPLQASIESVALFASDGHQWQRRTEFPLRCRT
jgi:2'-5' RNA ligase